jgi:hypothetical protein
MGYNGVGGMDDSLLFFFLLLVILFCNSGLFGGASDYRKC